MKFPFTHELTIDGVTIAEIDGNLIIEADDDSRFRGGDVDWTVEEIELKGCIENPAWKGLRETPSVEPVHSRTVTLPDDHFLHDRMLAELLKRHRRAIDEAWAAHLREARAAARRGFVAIAKSI